VFFRLLWSPGPVESRSKFDAARLRETPRRAGAVGLTAKVVLSASRYLPTCWASSAIVSPAPGWRARPARAKIQRTAGSITAISAMNGAVHHVGTGGLWKCVSKFVRRISTGTTRVVAIHWDCAIIGRGAENRCFAAATIAERAARAWIRKRQRCLVARRKGCARTFRAFGRLRWTGTAAYVWMREAGVTRGNGIRPVSGRKGREIHRLRRWAPYDCGRDSAAVCRAVHT